MSNLPRRVLNPDPVLVVPGSEHEPTYAKLPTAAQTLVRCAALCGWQVRLLAWVERDKKGVEHEFVRLTAVPEHTRGETGARHLVRVRWRDGHVAGSWAVIEREQGPLFTHVHATAVKPIIRAVVAPGAPGDAARRPAKRTTVKARDPYARRTLVVI